MQAVKGGFNRWRRAQFNQSFPSELPNAFLSTREPLDAASENT
ncbi:hypothetical protein ACPOL_2222 [Acidisarcina polymorpha]|uniref:Uncharacterized protein n=1 Tax=Acidisarcina polymorpha TaxID=2211140 RepID=A0A2Z5FYU8_9BACT|nr:hypothetical protein ACPOL_2222 [Acidisarcina polymorpha]